MTQPLERTSTCRASMHWGVAYVAALAQAYAMMIVVFCFFYPPADDDRLAYLTTRKQDSPDYIDAANATKITNPNT